MFNRVFLIYLTKDSRQDYLIFLTCVSSAQGIGKVHIEPIESKLDWFGLYGLEVYNDVNSKAK